MNHLADRIAEVRRDPCGEAGLPAPVDALDLPRRTRMNDEAGVVMPATVLLRFLVLTTVHPHWLPTGEGPQVSGPRR